mgnify:CR=1 FL=1
MHPWWKVRFALKYFWCASSMDAKQPKLTCFLLTMILACQRPVVFTSDVPSFPVDFLPIRTLRWFCKLVDLETCRRFAIALFALSPSMWSKSMLGIYPCVQPSQSVRWVYFFINANLSIPATIRCTSDWPSFQSPLVYFPKECTSKLVIGKQTF